MDMLGLIIYCIFVYKLLLFKPLDFFDLEPKPRPGEIFYYIKSDIAEKVFINPIYKRGAQISITEDQYDDLSDSEDNKPELIFKIRKLLEV